MTNKEYLESLSVEELVTSTMFIDCPYTYIYKKLQAEQGNTICQKDEDIKTMQNANQIADYVFSGRQRMVCNECKLKWLSAERRA